jgi:hypothetical protein
MIPPKLGVFWTPDHPPRPVQSTSMGPYLEGKLEQSIVPDGKSGQLPEETVEPELEEEPEDEDAAAEVAAFVDEEAT